MTTLFHKILSIIDDFRGRSLSRSDVFYSVLCLLFLSVQLVYLQLRIPFLTERVPLFYTRPWGMPQLADRYLLFLIPLVSFIVSLLGLFFRYYLDFKFFKYGALIVSYFVFAVQTLLTFSLFRIVNLTVLVSEPLVPLRVVQMFLPFLGGLMVALLLSPYYVKLMFKFRIVTDPTIHKHPGMILKRPSARGGGLFFALIFVSLSLALTSLNFQTLGVFALVLLLAFIGLLDDYQNTHPGSKLRFFENPLIRLSVLFLVVSGLYFFDIHIDSLTLPILGTLDLTRISFDLGFIHIAPVSWLFTTFWVVWVLNLLSWSNGVDGQYSGIVGIGLIVVGLLGLRFTSLTPEQLTYARLAFIASGVALGLTRVTWHPSKIMWGFGAMSAGLVLSTLAILVQSKIVASVLILLIPFLDAVVTFFRRLLSGRSPWKGDRGHLHHLLMAKGLSEKQTALFYWFVTALFGGLSFLSVDTPSIQWLLMFLGILFFGFILMSVRLSNPSTPSPQIEK